MQGAGLGVTGAKLVLLLILRRPIGDKLTLMIDVINGWNRIGVGFALFANPEEIKALQTEAAAW